jgi:CBS domain-containing protein
MYDAMNRAHPADPVRSIVVPGALAEVKPHLTLSEVAAELAADEVGVVLVDDPRGVLGLLSERDLVNAVAGGQDLDEVTAADAMTTDLVWADPKATVREVADLMLEAGVRHVPVGDGRVAIGVVSIRDVLAVLLGSVPAAGV